LFNGYWCLSNYWWAIWFYWIYKIKNAPKTQRNHQVAIFLFSVLRHPKGGKTINVRGFLSTKGNDISTKPPSGFGTADGVCELFVQDSTNFNPVRSCGLIILHYYPGRDRGYLTLSPRAYYMGAALRKTGVIYFYRNKTLFKASSCILCFCGFCCLSF